VESDLRVGTWLVQPQRNSVSQNGSLRPPATLWIQGTRRLSTCAAVMN